MSSTDPYANYAYGQTGIPQAYTQNLENLGYVGQPFASAEQTFADQVKYQQVLKNILDNQLQAFGNGGNTGALPFNMRNMFGAAAGVLDDPMYGIIGAPGMFSQGYKFGALPGNMSNAMQGYWESEKGYPGIAAPTAVGAVNGGSPNPVQMAGSYNNNYPVNNGAMQPTQQSQSNASIQAGGPGGLGGTFQGMNGAQYSGSYGNLTDAQKSDVNNYAHQMSG